MFHTEGISIASDMKQPLKNKQRCTAFLITKGKTGIELYLNKDQKKRKKNGEKKTKKKQTNTPPTLEN